MAHTNRAGRSAAAATLPVVIALASALAVALPMPRPAHAQAPSETKPYDEKLLRLAEIVGSVHYLRELCGAEDGQLWRNRIGELIAAEGSSAARKALLTRSFNKGWRNYSTHNTCTSSHQTALSRFMVEGAQIAEGILKSLPP